MIGVAILGGMRALKGDILDATSRKTANESGDVR
jgi:hypothetical protein